MKTKNLFVQAMLVVFTLISITAWAGNEESFNSSYKISPDLNFTPAAGFQKSWEISYGDSKTPVHVFLKETKKGQEYVVRTSYFEVKYVNGDKGFGVKLLGATESKVNENLNAAVLNTKQMEVQKCISASAISEEKVLDMIASYLPDLINEQYNNILN